MDEVKPGGLQLEQDLDFQRREWRAERLGWALMLIAAVAALLGLLGPGPASWVTAGEKGGALWVEYHRFERFKAPTALTVHVGPGAIRDGKVRVHISQSLMEPLDMATVTPQPDAVEAQGDQLIYTFAVAPSDAPTSLSFSGTTHKFGWWEGEVGLVGGPAYAIGTMIYP